MSSAPKWTPESKRFVFIACVILIALAVWRFSVVLAPLIVAVIIAYLLNPIVNWVSKRSRFRRSVVAAIIYIGFLSVLILIPTLLAPLLVQQLSNLDFNVQGLSDELDNAMGTQINIAGFEVDIPSLVEPVTGSLDSIFSPLAAWAANLAVGIAGGFIWAIFIFVVGYYILVDANRFTAWVDSWIPPDYLEEFKQLRRTIDGVWKSYFIGQVTLAIIVGVIISVATGILGIRSALILGLVAALLELIPNWGYGLSGAIGTAVAYFQGSSYIPLPNWAFALIVAGFYFLMWQVDTNYLVPRILGSRLQLPPAIIIIGIIAGASVGGALGLLLAAPTIATVKVLGSYIYRRLLDLEPYVLTPEPAVAANLTEPSSQKNKELEEQVRRNGS
ncbi:MAG TPA: AI-2E family transporter [Anaerolineae bacterium]|nr:AI-2E family transporter [Anaerolineae bacterium]MCB0222596.1 AI-2E family transporter [Anaerolineae bacterium]HRV94209.1 AI-2E family transporter [Anaerolineae bacterium]